jgi:hypothetical protein
MSRLGREYGRLEGNNNEAEVLDLRIPLIVSTSIDSYVVNKH